VSTTAGISLSKAERKKAQHYAIASKVFSLTIIQIVSGAIMMLYANDVLHFSPKRIASILAFIPLVAILKLALLNQVRRFGRVRTLTVTTTVQLFIVLLLLLIPAADLTFRLFLVLLVVYFLARELGAFNVWQPILRDITSHADRGIFFGRMRSIFTIVALIVIGATSAFIGSAITEVQYKILLGIAAFGLANDIFWIRKIPDREPETLATGKQAAANVFVRILKVIRSSPLLRRPLMVIILLRVCEVPIMAIYLRQMLFIPSNMVSLYILARTIGMALSFIIWGKISDAIGFKPMTMGLLTIAIVISPLYLLIGPLPQGVAWQMLDLGGLVTITALLVVGLFSGGLVAGFGIVFISIQHHYTQQEDSLEAMNVFVTVVMIASSCAMFFFGFLLQDVAMPRGIHSAVNGFVHFDWIKCYLVLILPTIQLVAMQQVSKLANARPYFGMGDFFTSITSSPMRTLYAMRHVHHEEENARLELARWMGEHVNPMGIDSLMELLEDPSYDVRVQALRSLARTKSQLVMQQLCQRLSKEEYRHLADHIAWALGELGYIEACDSLVAELSPDRPPRIRAMAARALGKIGNPAAIEPLVQVTASKPKSLHLVSSCCKALVELNATEHAELVFENLLKLGFRQERYELINALCPWLGISNEWLLQATAIEKPIHAIRECLDLRPTAWLNAHQTVIDPLMARDLSAIQAQVADAAKETGDPVACGMSRVLGRLKIWQGLATLAGAWLLFRESAPK